MVYVYVGKGTTVLGIRNKPVEQLQSGDRVLGFYIGIGTKQHTDSKVKSVKRIGRMECKHVGSRSDFALFVDGQKTVGPTFKYVSINDVVYSVGRNVPRPFKVHKTVPNVDVYEIELEDVDVVPLLSSYMFVIFSENKLNFQGGLSGEEKSKEVSSRKQKSETKQSRKKQKEDKPRRRGKRKPRTEADPKSGSGTETGE